MCISTEVGPQPKLGYCVEFAAEMNVQMRSRSAQNGTRPRAKFSLSDQCVKTGQQWGPNSAPIRNLEVVGERQGTGTVGPRPAAARHRGPWPIREHSAEHPILATGIAAAWKPIHGTIDTKHPRQSPGGGVFLGCLSEDCAPCESWDGQGSGCNLNRLLLPPDRTSTVISAGGDTRPSGPSSRHGKPTSSSKVTVGSAIRIRSIVSSESASVRPWSMLYKALGEGVAIIRASSVGVMPCCLRRLRSARRRRSALAAFTVEALAGAGRAIDLASRDRTPLVSLVIVVSREMPVPRYPCHPTLGDHRQRNTTAIAAPKVFGALEMSRVGTGSDYLRCTIYKQMRHIQCYYH